MFMYFLIAAELAILYTAFWYIYVREPKPLKIAGNPWGKYGESGFTAGGIDPTLPFVCDYEHGLSLITSDQPLGATHATLSILPAWLVGNPTITQEFLQAWRMWRNGELREPEPVEPAPPLVRARPRKPRMRRARRCRILLIEIMRDNARHNRKEPRPPFLSRLVKIFSRTFGSLKAKAR